MKQNIPLIALIVFTIAVYFWIVLLTYHQLTWYVVIIYFIVLLTYLLNNLFNAKY